MTPYVHNTAWDTHLRHSLFGNEALTCRQWDTHLRHSLETLTRDSRHSLEKLTWGTHLSATRDSTPELSAKDSNPDSSILDSVNPAFSAFDNNPSFSTCAPRNLEWVSAEPLDFLADKVWAVDETRICYMHGEVWSQPKPPNANANNATSMESSVQAQCEP